MKSATRTIATLREIHSTSESERPPPSAESAVVVAPLESVVLLARLQDVKEKQQAEMEGAGAGSSIHV
jgi:hypothetical protein